MHTPYKITSKKEHPHSELEYILEIPYEAVAKHRPKVIDTMSLALDLPGFRKGHIPESIIVGRVGEMAILEEALQMALQETYPTLLDAEKIDAVGHPHISVLKLAPNNPTEVSIRLSFIPPITLPDYKKSSASVNAEKLEAITVDEREIREVIEAIRKNNSHAHPEHKHELSHDETKPTEAEDASEEPHDHPLPEWNDAFVQTLGLENTDKAEEQIKQNIETTKTNRQREKKRGAIIEAILKDITIDLPNVVVDSEIMKIENEWKADLDRMKIPLEEYLKSTKKTIEEIRTEWRPMAEKKGRLQLTLNAIAETEKIVADPTDVDREVSHLLSLHKDADPIRARMYVETILTNEKVFQFLEAQQ